MKKYSLAFILFIGISPIFAIISFVNAAACTSNADCNQSEICQLGALNVPEGAGVCMNANSNQPPPPTFDTQNNSENSFNSDPCNGPSGRTFVPRSQIADPLVRRPAGFVASDKCPERSDPAIKLINDCISAGERNLGIGVVIPGETRKEALDRARTIHDKVLQGCLAGHPEEAKVFEKSRSISCAYAQIPTQRTQSSQSSASGLGGFAGFMQSINPIPAIVNLFTGGNAPARRNTDGSYEYNGSDTNLNIMGPARQGGNTNGNAPIRREVDSQGNWTGGYIDSTGGNRNSY